MSETPPEPDARPAPSCLACGVALEEGFLLDHAHLGIPYAADWASGPRKQGLLGAHVAGRRRLPIRAFRCPSCERIELYAPAVSRPRKRPL